MSLTDGHGREISYLRLAVTDRCNLRCFYCMPEEGIDYVSRKDLLSYEELERICKVASSMGVKKLRITGGEPFVRKDLLVFLQKLSDNALFEEIHITTNGVLTAPYIPELVKMGISGINLSLDSLDRERFLNITRRDKLSDVLQTMNSALEHNIPLKINMVVMQGLNSDDIAPMIELARENPVEIRFLEEMPFNGTGMNHDKQFLSYLDIEAILKELHPNMSKIPMLPGKTAQKYQIPGYRGNIGVIASFSRTFCGSCDRIRLTPVGRIKTCLYDQKGYDLREVLRGNTSDAELAKHIQRAVQMKYADGFEAEKDRNEEIAVESMATIGG